MEEVRRVFEEISRNIQRMVEDASREISKLGRDYKLAEESGLVRVEIDMPGLEPSDISLYVSSDGSRIRAIGQRGDRRYDKAIYLPIRIDPSTAQAIYRNGVLYITAKKVQEAEVKIPVQ